MKALIVALGVAAGTLGLAGTADAYHPYAYNYGQVYYPPIVRPSPFPYYGSYYGGLPRYGYGQSFYGTRGFYGSPYGYGFPRYGYGGFPGYGYGRPGGFSFGFSVVR